MAGVHTSDRVTITRIFNYGTLAEWQRMKRRYTPAQIRAALEHPLRGQWTRRAKRFAEVLFNVRLPEEVLISYDA